MGTGQDPRFNALQILLHLKNLTYFFFFQKFFSPEVIQNPQLVLIVGCTGLAINLIGLLLFHDHGHSHGGGGGGGGGGHGHSHGGGASHGHSHDGKKHNHSHGGQTDKIEKNGNVLPAADADLVTGPKF